VHYPRETFQGAVQPHIPHPPLNYRKSSQDNLYSNCIRFIRSAAVILKQVLNALISFCGIGMEKAIKIINEMHAAGLFSRYAIGGGIAALFYIDPVTTFDLDVFIILPETSTTLVSLSPLYLWLEKRGYKPRKEQVVIEGISVQFIPVYNDLIMEAVLESVRKRYGATPTFVVSPEYLAAIMVQTSRRKDRERLARLLDESEFSRKKLDALLVKHRLEAVFKDFIRRYYGQKS
jgi:hypothetical protein